MKLFEFVSQFFTDLLRLPFMFKVVLLWGVGAWGWQWQKQRKEAQIQSAALGWPEFEARVVYAQVSDRKKEGRHGNHYWEGLLTYSYSVPGQELEVGEYRKRFDMVEDADAWAAGLRDTRISVRVDPSDAKRSRWLDDEAIAESAADLPSLSPSASGLPVVRDATDAEALAVLCTAGAGAALALWIQISSLMGKPSISAQNNTEVFFGMHVGAILCAIASGAFVAKKAASGAARTWGRSMKRLSADMPLLKVIGAYVTAVFIYGWVRMGAQDGQPDKWGSVMFSALWFFFYVISAATCWRYLTASRKSSAQNRE